ncbi:hypothetical protein TWF694_011675 [Orbilia ellipsospora]|uniref:PB1 domain-containing protein n=1 Tax=Orbilia ellipsospora TaxID=2528407 RepID=A0AAV9X5Y7_9PEZI
MEKSNSSKTLSNGYQDLPSTKTYSRFHPSDVLHADSVSRISNYLLTNTNVIQLLAEHNAATSRSDPKNQHIKSNKRMLVRCITLDPDTLKICSPCAPAYRVIELHGSETYDELVGLVSRKFKFDDAPSKTLRSIQCHDTSETIQIVVDGDEAVCYFLERVDELRISVFVFENEKDRKTSAGVSVLLTSQFDPSAIPYHQPGPQRSSSPQNRDHRSDRASYDGSDADDSYAQPHRGRPPISRPERGSCQRSKSASPAKEGRYSFRDRNYQNDPREHECEGSEFSSHTASISPSSYHPHSSDQDQDSISIRGRTKADTPGYDYPICAESGQCDEEKEDGEIAALEVNGSLRGSPPEPISRAPNFSSGQSQTLRVSASSYNERQWGNDVGELLSNNQRNVYRGDNVSEARFCRVYISEAGKNQWVLYDVEKLRVRVDTSDRLHSTWDKVADELYDRTNRALANPTHVGRQRNLVLMVYMRVLPRPSDATIYNADGDVGILINPRSLERGSFRHTFVGADLVIEFRTMPGARIITRSTDIDARETTEGPKINRASHVGINLEAAVGRIDHPNYKAIQALCGALRSDPEAMDVRIEVARSQLTGGARKVLSYHGNWCQHDPALAAKISQEQIIRTNY